jgi:hypothetical protein
MNDRQCTLRPVRVGHVGPCTTMMPKAATGHCWPITASETVVETRGGWGTSWPVAPDRMFTYVRLVEGHHARVRRVSYRPV